VNLKHCLTAENVWWNPKTRAESQVHQEGDRWATFPISGGSRGWQSREFGPQHPITRKLDGMHADAQALLQENLEGKDR